MKKHLPILFTACLAAFSSMSFAATIPVTTDTFSSYNGNGNIAVFTERDSIEGTPITASSLSDALKSVNKLESVNNDNDRKLSDLTNKVSQLESKNSEQASKIDRLQSSIDEMKRSNDSLSSQIKELSSKIK